MNRPRRHTRRQFLRDAVGGPLLLSLTPSVPLLLARAAAQAGTARSESERVLVVIQLTGGNDGLNTVVPFEDDAYARRRPTLRLRAHDLHKITPQLGLHPRMTGFARLFNEGRLAIIQGVGGEGLSRDHEAALRSWQTSSFNSEPMIDTGWLGRAADRIWQQARPAAPAVFVGKIPRPFGINAASVVVPSILNLEEATGTLKASAATASGVTAPSLLLRHVQSSMALAQTHALGLAGLPHSATAYPDSGLGQDLRTVAQLIRANIGLRICYTELGGGGIGGFDNHANQMGNHCALLEQLSESVAAFAADLDADHLLDRVLLLTFSEFGRTASENGRRGTDHGAAGPMFLVGGKVRAGVHGAHPSLTDLTGDALKHHTDFRSVYATVLDQWLGVSSRMVLGDEFPLLTLLA